MSTVSPPGSTFPQGVELPHVAAPPGETGVPPGEGCYSCNVNNNGIPLERPLNANPQNLRNKRDTSATLTADNSTQSVSGQAGNSSGGWTYTKLYEWGCILVQVTIYHRLRIGRDGHLDQSEAYDIS